MSEIGIIILAAGASTRLNKPKQLVPFEGKSLLRRSADVALACGCDHVVVVLGYEADTLAHEVRDLPVEVVHNDDWAVGISSSIKSGLTRLRETDPNISAVVIMLCDQPFVKEKTITSLMDNYRSTGKPIVASEYDGILGVPALFGREMFDALLKLEGDAGARVVIRQNAGDRVSTIQAPEAAFDVDTIEDFERMSSKVEVGPLQ